MIEIRDLHKYYGERRAIGPLSATIEAGEVVGLLGLNGAGKTTTLRILACDLLPSDGSVTVDGIDVVERPHEVRSRIGYLPDTPPLYPEMTVAAFLTFAARLRGVSAREAGAQVSEALEQTDLTRVANDPVSSLSHGFKQRVGIAQAIVHRPRLLVLDEPITGLDPVQIVEMRELIRGLKGDRTILLSSHILSEISETCDRILVIKDGTIAASGTEAELTGRLRPRIVLTVRGNLVKAREALAKLAGVRDVEDRAAPVANAEVHTLEIDAEGDQRAEVSRAIVGAGLDLLELSSGTRELESLFLELAATAPVEGQDAAPRKKRRTMSAAKEAT